MQDLDEGKWILNSMVLMGHKSIFKWNLSGIDSS